MHTTFPWESDLKRQHRHPFPLCVRLSELQYAKLLRLVDLTGLGPVDVFRRLLDDVRVEHLEGGLRLAQEVQAEALTLASQAERSHT